MILIDKAQSNNNKTIDIMSESYPHLEGGAIKDFKSIMIDRGYFVSDRWNETKHFYTFETGSVIKFISIDNIGKAHGPRRDILFLNEANHTPWGIVDQLIIRTAEEIWMDWNPSEDFWYYNEIEGKKDHDFVTLTYLDNESLPKEMVEEIESHKSNKNWWTVYGLGQRGSIEGKVYNGWDIIDDIPREARLERTGVDFGYTNDPTAIIDIYKYNGEFILDEVIYQKGLSNKDIADTLKTNDFRRLVIADSAEPKSIDEIKLYGVNIQPAIKGKGSILQGIQYVQDQKISVTKRSVNLLKEYRNYLWQTDSSGVNINVPIDIFNHALDAVRYGFSSYRPATNNNLTGNIGLQRHIIR
jgi:phage terminase large subunit